MAANQNNVSPEQQEEQKVILIVEDDPVLLRMYKEKLTHEGFRVVTARDGEEALKVTRDEKMDLILLDIMLPRMSGTDFLERLIKEGDKNIPVFALTNLTEQEERERAEKLGVKEYLVKAMQTPEEVVEKIKSYFSGQKNLTD